MKVKNHDSKIVNYPLIDLVNPAFWGYDFDSTNSEEMRKWTLGPLSSGKTGTNAAKGMFMTNLYFPYDPENRKKHFHGVTISKEGFYMDVLTRSWIRDADSVDFPFMGLKADIDIDLENRTFIRSSLGYEYVKLWNIGEGSNEFPLNPSKRTSWTDDEKFMIYQIYQRIGRPEELSIESNLFEPIYELEDVIKIKP